MNATRTAALAALAAGLAGAACTSGGRTPTTVITIAPVQAPVASPSPINDADADAAAEQQAGR
ncbi:MAG TPA: hypothetical protein VF519_02630 [Mycobacteriales bacterium]|jgi:hypothetical protein